MRLKVDYLNTLLIVFSFFLAYLLPFKLFLLSYAVLGPLHYLTEINWIKRKDYFIRRNNKFWVTLCIVLALLVSIPFFLKLPLLVSLFDSRRITTYQNVISKYTNIAIFTAFIISILLIVNLRKTKLYLLVLLAILLGFILVNYTDFNLWVGLFLPTILHVYFFTIFFMLYGNIKDETYVGYFNVVLLLLVPILITFIEVKPLLGFSSYLMKTYVENKFYVLSLKILETLNLSDGKSFDFSNPMVLKVQMFISFAYTYHYLNWFSKTNLIGWYREISQKQLAIVVLIWSISMFLYYYDYRVGLVFLLFLSFMHVFLEFPINIVSIKGIIVELVNRRKR